MMQKFSTCQNNLQYRIQKKMGNPEEGGETSAIQQQPEPESHNQAYESEPLQTPQPGEMTAHDVPVLSNPTRNFVESTVQRVSNELPLNSLVGRHPFVGGGSRETHLRPHQHPIHAGVPQDNQHKQALRQTVPAQSPLKFNRLQNNHSMAHFHSKPQSAQVSQLKLTATDPIVNQVTYAQNHQSHLQFTRQNYHMRTLQNQRVVSNSSVSAEMKLPRSGSPPARVPYQSAMSNNIRSSIHSGSSIHRRPSITFTYGSFRHNYHSGSPPQSRFQYNFPLSPPPEENPQSALIWEKRFIHVSEIFSHLYKEFRAFTHQYTVITKQLEPLRPTPDLQEVKEQYFQLLRKIHEKQQEMGKLHEQYEQYLQLCEENEEDTKDDHLKKKYKTLEKDYDTLVLEFQRFKEIFQRQKQNQDELQHQLISVTKKYEDLQEQYCSKRNDSDEKQELQNYNLQLQGYLQQLQKENQQLRERIKNIPDSDRSEEIEEKSKLIISNQGSIISNLETQLKYLQQEKVNLIKQIQELQEKQPQQESQSNEQNTIIIKKLEEENIILNEQLQKKNKQYQVLQISEDQLKKVVQAQGNIIKNLENQLAILHQKQEGKCLNSQIVISQIEPLHEKIKQLEQQLLKKDQFFKRESQKVEALLTIRQKSLSEVQKELDQMKNTVSELRSVIQQKDEQIGSMKKSVQIEKDEKRSNDGFKGGKCNKIVLQLEEEIDRLSGQLRKKQQEKRLAEEKTLTVEENLQRTIMERDSQIRLLKDQIKVSSEEYERKLKDKQRIIKNIEADLNKLRMSQNLADSRGSIAPSSPLNSNKNFQQMEDYKAFISKNELEIRQLKRQRDERDKKMHSYEKTISQLEDELISKNKEISQIKRQLSGAVSYESEVKTLNDTLAKKNKEILELKSCAYQKNQLLIEIESLKNERNNLRETLKIRVKEIQKLRDMVLGYQDKFKESAKIFKSRDIDSDEYLLMEKSVRKKDTEISKLKQSVQLKDTNIQELEYEVEKLKGKLHSNQRLLQHEREEARQKIEYLQNRVRELEYKAKSLDETQKISKNKYEDEIQILDVTVKQKEDIIRRLQGELKVTKLKMKGHDNKVQQYDEKIEELNEKIRTLQNTNSELQKNADGNEDHEKTDKNKLYDQYQIRIADLEADVNIKDKKIKHLENSIQTLKLKSPEINRNQDYINQQQIEVLRKKVAEYQSKIYAQSTRINFKVRDIQSGQLFEKKVIYELKSENQRLKAILAAKGIQNENIPLEFGNRKSNQQNPHHINFIERRLIDFNKKLEDVIQTNNFQFDHETSIQNNIPKQEKYQLMRSFERQRNLLAERHKKQMLLVQNRLIDLQKYCSSLQAQISKNHTSFTAENQRANTARTFAEKSTASEQINFYKEKNKQLEERVDTHIKVNKQLKDKLQNLIKNNGDGHSNSFYKDQIVQLEGKLKDSAQKIDKLNDQNKSLRVQASKNTLTPEIQAKYIQLQNTNYELNRKISQLAMQQASYTVEIDRFTSQIQILEEQNRKIKQITKQKTYKQNNQEAALKEWKNKCSEYQLQLLRQKNKEQYQKKEIENLQQKMREKEKEENFELNKIQKKYQTLQEDYNIIKEEAEKYKHDEAVNSDKIAILNDKVIRLEEQISTLSQINTNFMRKQKQSELSEFGLEQQTLKLKNELKLIQSEKEQLQLTAHHLQNQITQLSSANRSQQIQLQRLEAKIHSTKLDKEAEGNQTKQRLTYIADMQDRIKKLKQEVQEEKNLHSITQDSLYEANNQLSTMHSQIQYLHQELKIKLQQMEQLSTQLHLHGELYYRLKYQVEYMRSCYLELEVLLGEMEVKCDERNVKVMEQTRKQLSKGLSVCVEMGMIINE